MRRPIILIFAILFSATHSGIAEAGYSLKVTVIDINQIWMQDQKSTFLKGDPEILEFKRKLTSFSSTGQAKSQAISMCKQEGVYFNTRIKVLDARRATSGLGNLKSVAVSNMRIVSQTRDLPEYTEEEEEYLESEYSLYSEYPDYIEDGYVDNFLEFKCTFTGVVSITASNAYQIYVDGDLLGEFSKAELAKKKWSVSAREDQI
jgi:hypothetical protein